MATAQNLDNEVRNLAQRQIAWLEGLSEARQTYIRILALATIKELGVEPRTNTREQKKRLNPEEQAKQLAALTTVHDRFYAIVTEVVEKSLSDVPAKERVRQRNRRSNFARTAVYTIRRFIKAGKDLTLQAPAKLNKYALRVTTAPRPTTPRRLKGRVERMSKTFMAVVLELSEADKEAAAAELNTLIGQLAAQLAALGRPAVRDAQQAAEEHRPFRSGATLFVPTATAVLRQQERPS